MPVSIAAQGTTTPTLGTASTLATITPPTGGGVYLLQVDAANLANGETLTLVLRTRARPSGTTRDAYTATWAHVQSDPIKPSPVVAVPAGSELVATLRQNGGTARAFDWAVLRIDA